MLNFTSKILAVKYLRDMLEHRKPPVVEIKEGVITIQYTHRASLLEIKNVVEALMRLGVSEYVKRGPQGFEEYCGTMPKVEVIDPVTAKEITLGEFFR